MATNKSRLAQLEKQREQAKKERATVTDLLSIRKVDYRTGLIPGIVEPVEPADVIPVRIVDYTKAVTHDNE